MAKFFGPIGYSETKETSPGIWQEQISERNYYGDILRNVGRVRDGSGLNDDITVDNRLSIVADAFLNNNFHLIRYVSWMGVLWSVLSVDVQRPRLILTLGDVYNGKKA